MQNHFSFCSIIKESPAEQLPTIGLYLACAQSVYYMWSATVYTLQSTVSFGEKYTQSEFKLIHTFFFQTPCLWSCAAFDEKNCAGGVFCCQCFGWWRMLLCYGFGVVLRVHILREFPCFFILSTIFFATAVGLADWSAIERKGEREISSLGGIHILHIAIHI